MRLREERIDVNETVPEEVRRALFLIGHWLAKTSPDLKGNFNVTEGDLIVQYDFEMKEVKRFPWLVDASVDFSSVRPNHHGLEHEDFSQAAKALDKMATDTLNTKEETS